jgi:hypothetical protein
MQAADAPFFLARDQKCDNRNNNQQFYESKRFYFQHDFSSLNWTEQQAC